MDIGGYDIGQVFHIGARGPLWRTRTNAGEALIALRSADDGRRCLPRWKAWARVSSHHVVALRDVVQSDDGRWAIVYDYVHGRPLDVEIGSADLRPKATRRQIVEGIAAGLGALHAAGIVHGDLTPANIMVTPEGRAVIIDLIDEIGEGEGTPGWSMDSAGMEGDRQCLRRIASLLEMDEVLTQLGYDEVAAAVASGATPVFADPEEHVIAREPVDPEQVIADLRAAALREDTAVEDEGYTRRTRRRTRAGEEGTADTKGPTRTRAALVGGIAELVLALGVGGYAGWRALTSRARPSEGESIQSQSEPPADPCDVTAVTDLINHAIETRDQAVIAGDASGLDAVLGGELLDQDTDRIESMRSGGVRVEALVSHVENVSVVSCEPGAIDVSATLSILESRTCVEATCDQHGAPNSATLTLRVDPVSRKVVAATAPPSPDSEQAESGREE